MDAVLHLYPLISQVRKKNLKNENTSFIFDENQDVAVMSNSGIWRWKLDEGIVIDSTVLIKPHKLVLWVEKQSRDEKRKGTGYGLGAFCIWPPNPKDKCELKFIEYYCS